eukprot:scaffold96680_cov27-Tisochrysis_lutea.AAC.1
MLTINGAPFPIEYSVRNCRELGGDIKNLNIHAGPKGCKGYNKGLTISSLAKAEDALGRAGS